MTQLYENNALASLRAGNFDDLMQRFPMHPNYLNLTDVDFNKVNQDLVEEYRLANVFAFLKIDGKFDYLKTRIAPKQDKPSSSLLEVAKKQSKLEYEDINGTLLGYYAPAIWDKVAVPGWHLHFISSNRKVVGHVLDFRAIHLTGEYEVLQHFPVHN